MKKNNLIVVLVMGNIGTGKSHFINSLYKPNNWEFVIPDLNTKVGKDRIVETSLREGKNVLVEGIYAKSSERELFIQTINNLFPKTEFYCYNFGPGDASTLSRRIKYPRNLSAEEWTNIHNTNQCFYSKPTESEGFSKIVSK